MNKQNKTSGFVIINECKIIDFELDGLKIERRGEIGKLFYSNSFMNFPEEKKSKKDNRLFSFKCQPVQDENEIVKFYIVNLL